jgi:hypothetical protein
VIGCPVNPSGPTNAQKHTATYEAWTGAISQSKFELLINLRTAKAVSIAIPSALLLQADQVREAA